LQHAEGLTPALADEIALRPGTQLEVIAELSDQERDQAAVVRPRDRGRLRPPYEVTRLEIPDGALLSKDVQDLGGQKPA
jgi:hypothetical protein